MRNIQQLQEKLEKDKKFRIVFVGDSLTSCEWVHPNWREIMKYILKEELQSKMSDWKIPSWGIRCINCGYDGSTTQDILDKMDEILDYKPDLIMILMGGNDRYFNISTDQHKENITKMLNLMKEKANIVFCTSIPDGTGKFKEAYRPHAEAASSIFPMDGVQFIDMFNVLRQFNFEKFFTFISESGNNEAGIEPGEVDNLHPNQLGNAYIAKVFLKEVFGIELDPEKYIKENLEGKMFPSY